MNKNTLRNEIRQHRAVLPKQYIAFANERITEAVLSSALFRDAKTIFIYVSTPAEPDTRSILEAAWSAGKTVCVPRCRKKPLMDAVCISGFGDLAPGVLGIPEPRSDLPAADPESLDLAIVPCVTASLDGRRLGHGAAYYDAFLDGLSLPKLCLCFGRLLGNDIPSEAHDVNMDYLATENGIINCRVPST